MNSSIPHTRALAKFIDHMMKMAHHGFGTFFNIAKWLSHEDSLVKDPI